MKRIPRLRNFSNLAIRADSLDRLKTGSGPFLRDPLSPVGALEPLD